MFIRILLLGLLVAGLIGFLRWYANAPKEEASKILWRGIFGLLFLILVGLVVTGRLNWLFAVVAALIPFVRKLLPLLRFLPFLNSLYKRHQAQRSGQDQAGPGSQGNNRGGRGARHAMTRAEALEILGLKDGATREDVVAAHRKLMLKAHPDRGGSDWLASQINEAKSVLLK